MFNQQRNCSRIQYLLIDFRHIFVLQTTNDLNQPTSPQRLPSDPDRTVVNFLIIIGTKVIMLLLKLKRIMKLNHFMTRKAIVDVIAALLILLFTYTAVSKLMGMDLFKVLLAQSPGIGNHAAWLYIALPSVELIIAALLFFPGTRLKGLYASCIMMLSFTIYVGYMLSTGSELPCSCGGVIAAMTWQQHLYFNIFFTLAAMAGIILHSIHTNAAERGNRPLLAHGSPPHG